MDSYDNLAKKIGIGIVLIFIALMALGHSQDCNKNPDRPSCDSIADHSNW